MTKLVLIALGGALGSVFRYAMQGWVQRWSGGSFPTGTLAVNMLGCLIIGVLAAAFAGPILIREEYRVGLMVGVLGGFTTFSAFELETFNLVTDRQFGLALANVAISVTLGFAAVWIGYRVAERWFGV
jgi:CrcB protein